MFEKRRIPAILIPLLMMGCAARADDWAAFSPPDESVTFSSPGPMHEDTKAMVSDERSFTRQYEFRRPDQSAFVFATTRVRKIKLDGPKQSAAIDALIPEMTKQFAQGGYASVVTDSSDVPYSNGKAKEFFLRPAANDGVHVRIRVYVNESRMRIFEIIGSQAFIKGQEAQRYLDSIKLVD